jgi:hypothetical protein
METMSRRAAEAGEINRATATSIDPPEGEASAPLAFALTSRSDSESEWKYRTP